MNVFSRSMEIYKLSLNVIKQDKEMLLFPFLAGISSLIFLILMIFPAFGAALLEGTGVETGPLMYTMLFILYFGIAFIATFFNVCVVYTAKTRFSGGDATFGDSIQFALSRIHTIFLWAIVSATVGLILRVIENLAQRAGGIGRIITIILAKILGAVWGILTIFVVPAMVYKDIGPFAAIKNSIGTLKKTWGESLVRHFSLGILQFVAFLIGGVIFFVLFVTTSSLGGYVLLSVVLLGFIYFIGIILFFSVLNSIFNTALFEYASTGRIPSGFNQEVMASAFENKRQQGL